MPELQPVMNLLAGRYVWVVLGEHAFRVRQPERGSRRPDGKAFCLKLPFVVVARETFRRCGRASYRHDILHTHKSQAVSFRDVVKCFRMLNVEVTVDEGPVDVLTPLTR